MIDDYTLGRFLSDVFLPVVPFVVGFVLAFLTLLLLYITFRDIASKGS